MDFRTRKSLFTFQSQFKKSVHFPDVRSAMGSSKVSQKGGVTCFGLWAPSKPQLLTLALMPWRAGRQVRISDLLRLLSSRA